jgi:hypothetical protein
VEDEISDVQKLRRDQELLEIVRAHDYQTITISMANGRIVRVGRKIPTKLTKTTGKS